MLCLFSLACVVGFVLFLFVFVVGFASCYRV